MNVPQFIQADNALAYARQVGLIADESSYQVRELTGGVSNIVLLVEPTDASADGSFANQSLSSQPFVLKQAREQLRVGQPWFCDVRRIWREVDVLLALSQLLRDLPCDAGLRLQVPKILWEDRENYLYAMTAIDPSIPTWKEQLLGGVVHSDAAEAAGKLLGFMHGQSWRSEAFRSQLTGREFFEALRVDPYYRHVQSVIPELSSPLQTLIDSLADHALCLVHGDFSPKNLLVGSATLTLLDFEVGHFGDPAFDAGFLLSHLVLKYLWSGLQDRYGSLLTSAVASYSSTLQPFLTDEAWNAVRMRSCQNLGGCLLARVAGKSPVDYLNSQQQATALAWGETLLTTDSLPCELAPWLTW